MSQPAPRSSRVRVVPCDRERGCYRWLVSSGDGRREERSAYAFASHVGAKIVGELKARELDAQR